MIAVVAIAVVCVALVVVAFVARDVLLRGLADAAERQRVGQGHQLALAKVTADAELKQRQDDVEKQVADLARRVQKAELNQLR